MATSLSHPDPIKPPMSPYVADLTEGEHMIVWSLRRIAVAKTWCPLIDFELARIFKKHQGDVRAAFQQLVSILADHGRRRLRLGLPGMPTLTVDEKLILAILAAAQAQEPIRLKAHLTWLLGRSETQKLFPVVTVIAAGLALNGFPIRTPQNTLQDSWQTPAGSSAIRLM